MLTVAFAGVSGAVVAGHLLKHLAAAMGGFAIAHALRRPALPATGAAEPASDTTRAGSS